MIIVLAWLLSIVSVTLFVHTCYSLYLALYAWNDPRRLQPEVAFAPPRLWFTVLIPARHEEEVIAETIQRVFDANYPKDLLEILVICSSDDQGTIRAAQEAIEQRNLHAEVLTFSDGPINKPHGLNVGLRKARGDYVAVFDAEDDVHPDIFSAVNATALREGSDVIQGPVQLMDYDSRWYSTFCVLEYFIHYSSRLRYQALKAAVTLGGNTVFFKRSTLESLGGWDEGCLTEDAEIGIRMGAQGASIHVLYHPALATREETPNSVAAFVRQRTRWHQGFIQVLRKRDWLRLPGFGAVALAFFTMFFPIYHGFTTLLWPIALTLILFVDIPVAFALLTYLPVYALILLYVVNVVMLWEFTRVYHLPFRPSAPLVMAITFLPFQWLLGISSIRAVIREALGHKNWEKTFHPGSHRQALDPQLAQVEAVRIGAERE